MPTVVAHHDVKDKDHWLASTKREEFFGPLGVSNIRTFVDPQNPNHVAVMMDVAGHGGSDGSDARRGGGPGDGARRRVARDPRDACRGVASPHQDSTEPA